MRHRALIGSLVVLLGICLAPTQAGLIIQRNFTGGAAPGNMAGGGNLINVFNRAADWWESAYTDPNGDGTDFNLSIDYQWAGLGGGTLGVHQLTGQGGSPNRETSAFIRFDNDGSSVWFADPTPGDNSEYTNYNEFSNDFGGGELNSGRVFSGATGFASGRFDLLTVALHEIGHALGLSSANNAFQAENADGDIDVTTGPWDGGFAGTVLSTRNGAHLGDAGNSTNNALYLNMEMYPFASASIRKFGSAADILANAQISRFHNPVLAPALTAVPEPATLVVWSILGLCGAGYHRRRRRSAAAA